MRLLTVFPSTVRGGAEEYALTIAKAARAHGWEVHAAFPYTGKTSTLVGDFRHCGIAFHSLAIDEKWEDKYRFTRGHHLIRFVRAVSLFLAVRPAVVHLVLPLPYFGVGAMLACAVLNIPTAIVFQLVDDKTDFGPKLLRAYHWSKSRRQEWIAVSCENRRLLCASFGLGEQEIQVIYNGACLREPEPTPMSLARREVRRELGLNEQDSILLTVGRLVPQKGYLDLAAVAPQILAEFPDITFVWVGEGGQREQLEKIVRDTGIANRVRLLGYRRDVPRLMRAADLFVFPSHFEGQPIAIAEAMAAGLPIVSSDASGIPEVIESGVHGVLYLARDGAALAGAIRWALSNPTPMRTMGQNAVSRSRDFSAEQMCNQTLRLINDLRMKKCSAGKTSP